MTKSASGNCASKEEQEELDIFRQIRPYIARCLTLNHEINNPLAGIVGYCEFLLGESDQLSESQRDYLNQIMICAERIRSTVSSLCEEKMALDTKVDVAAAIERFKEEKR